MVQRGNMVDERGRLWMSGQLSAREYFAAVTHEAHQEAEESVRRRLAAVRGTTAEEPRTA